MLSLKQPQNTHRKNSVTPTSEEETKAQEVKTCLRSDSESATESAPVPQVQKPARTPQGTSSVVGHPRAHGQEAPTPASSAGSRC